MKVRHREFLSIFLASILLFQVVSFGNFSSVYAQSKVTKNGISILHSAPSTVAPGAELWQTIKIKNNNAKSTEIHLFPIYDDTDMKINVVPLLCNYDSLSGAANQECIITLKPNEEKSLQFLYIVSKYAKDGAILTGTIQLKVNEWFKDEIKIQVKIPKPDLKILSFEPNVKAVKPGEKFSYELLVKNEGNKIAHNGFLKIKFPDGLERERGKILYDKYVTKVEIDTLLLSTNDKKLGHKEFTGNYYCEEIDSNQVECDLKSIGPGEATRFFFEVTVSKDTKEGTILKTTAISGNSVKAIIGGGYDDEKHSESSINSPLVTAHTDDIKIIKKEAKFVSNPKDQDWPFVEFMWKLEHLDGRPASKIIATIVMTDQKSYDEFFEPIHPENNLLSDRASGNFVADKEGTVSLKHIFFEPGKTYRAKIVSMGYLDEKSNEFTEIDFESKNFSDNEISVKVPFLVVKEKEYDISKTGWGGYLVQGHYKIQWADGSKFNNDSDIVGLVAFDGIHEFGLASESKVNEKGDYNFYSDGGQDIIHFELDGSEGDSFTIRPLWYTYEHNKDLIVFGDKNLLHITIEKPSKILKLDKSKTFVKPAVMDDAFAVVQFAFVDDDDKPIKDTQLLASVNYTYPYHDGTYTETDHFIIETGGIAKKTIPWTTNEAQGGVVYEVVSVEDMNFIDTGFKLQGIEPYKVSVVDRRIMWDKDFGSMMQWQFKYDGYDKYVHEWQGACGTTYQDSLTIETESWQCNGFLKDGWWGLAVHVGEDGEVTWTGKVGYTEGSQIEYTGDGDEFSVTVKDFWPIKPSP